MLSPKDITPKGSVAPVNLIELVAEPIDLPVPDIDLLRRKSYEATADPLFFKWKRGEATEQDWLDAVQAVKDAHPKDEESAEEEGATATAEVGRKLGSTSKERK